jgi:serine/threonine protein kinase
LKSFIQFFGLGTIQDIDENVEEGEIEEMHLVMELMDSNLSTMLKEVERPLPYHVAVDIMLQIAKGVYYLHDMQVAHLDLKPNHVLCSSIPMEHLVSYRIFKVMDYRTSELEVCSNPESTQYTIGTPQYRAPEMIKGSETPRYLFQADVWSFAMICSEILSGKVPYSNLKPKEICNKLQGFHGSSFRPTLPNDCEGLTTLIQECWSQDPLQRPTFSNICDRLISLKKSFLKEGSCALGDSKSIVNHVPRV